MEPTIPSRAAGLLQTPSGRFFALFGLCLGLVLQPVEGQTTFTWDGGGGDNNWSTGANWVGDSAPSRNESTAVTFTGSSRLSPFNNQGDWSRLAGMTFAAGAGGFRIEGNNIGFVNSGGEQFINQNSSTTQEINTLFSFGSNQDSRINLNAGDLLISSPNLWIDMSSSTWRKLTVGASDSLNNTRRTLTISGNVNKGSSGNDPDIFIQNNKRLLVTGSLNYGSANDAALMVEHGVVQFSGSGGMTGGAVVLGANSGSAAASLLLDTAGSSFGRNVILNSGTSGRRTLAGLNTTGTTTFSGAISGGGEYDLAATTGGTAAFSGTRNFNAGMHVNRADGATTYGGTVVLSGSTTSTDYTALYSGTLQFNDFNQLGAGHVEFNASSGNSGTLRYTGGSTTTTKTIWIDNPGITRAAIDVQQAATTLTWNPGGNINQNITKVGAGTLILGENRLTGSATLGVENGKLTLTGANTFSGGTAVSGGTLEISGGSVVGGSASGLGTGSVAIGPGGAVRYWLSESGNHTIANAFNLSGGTLHTEDGANTFAGAITLGAASSSLISARYEDTITFSGGLTGSGNVNFTQSGGTGVWAAPTYVLSAAGSNSGNVRVSGSSSGGATKLRLGHVDALQSATLDLATGDAGVVEFAVAGANTYKLGGLSGSRNLALGGNSLDVGGNNGTTQFSGNISGTGGLTKTGTGELRLSANQGYTGNTAVTGGTLIVQSGATLASTTTTVGSGAHLKVDGGVGAVQVTGRLSGSGSVGAMTLNSGGTLAAGSAPGSMSSMSTTSSFSTMSGGGSQVGTLMATSATWNSGSTFEFEIINATGFIGVDWDLLDVSGALNLSGISASSKMNLTVLSSGLMNYDPNTQYSWVFAQAASLAGTESWASGLDVTDRFTITSSGFNGGVGPGQGFKVLTGTDGGGLRTLSLQAVPEPSSASLVILGLAAVLARRRRGRGQVGGCS